MKAGPHLLCLFNFPGPYNDNSKENVAWLPLAIQRQAWIGHSACIGVDYMNNGVDVELAYCVLSKLVAEMLDDNCTGIYLPRDNRLIPHYESAYLELQKFSSSRELGILRRPRPDMPDKKA
jgi:hypothetical protein